MTRSARRTFVVATAGHIDHGKSALVQALTGTDPDRLEDEKRRQMTIDLGFAHFDLPCGQVGLVDVPGHQRFMRNMLAGVHGIDAALLVVAATEGPMPQTLEHVGVLTLLGVDRGVVALSKCDLVEADWLQLVTEELASCLDGSSLAEAPVVAVSSRTGQGVQQIKDDLERVLASAPVHQDGGDPRLPVDRSFSLRGFGTVVTGTLAGGSLELGDQPVLLPTGRQVRVRGLQQHNRPVKRALPGSRTAVNLAGVQRSEVRRGDVLTRPDLLVATSRLGVRIQVLPGAEAPVRHRARLLVYHGTAEVSAQVLLLEGETLEPGGSGLAQLRLDAPVAAAPQDRFVLRLLAAPLIVAGGVVLDLDYGPLRRREALSRLAGRESEDPEAWLLTALREAKHGLTRRQLLAATGVAEDVLDRAVRSDRVREVGRVLMARERWDALEQQARSALEAHDRQHPLRAGMPREEFRSRMHLPRQLLTAVVGELVARGVVTESGGTITLLGYESRPTAEQQRVIDAVLEELGRQPFAPPSLPELGLRLPLTPDVIEYLVTRQLVVRLGKDTLMLVDAWAEALHQVRGHLQREGRINAAQARQLFPGNRRAVLFLLDWLDGRGETVRRGDEHHALVLTGSQELALPDA
jgi:selenocysteine-specific elongation factor